MSLATTHYRFTVDDYRRLADLGILPPSDRIELLDGEIVMGDRPYRFTFEEYHRMGEIGLLPSDARIELLEGEIVEMSPIGARHCAIVARLTDTLLDRLRGRIVLWNQSDIRLNDFGSPQPDIVLARYRDDYYVEAHPRPADVLLLVEVADSSLRFDRQVKVPLYARDGIVEVWVVDVNGRTIERYRDPVGGEYREVDELAPRDTIATAFAPDVTFEVTDLIG